MLTVTALLAASRPPFVAPLDKQGEADRCKQSFARGMPSDHFALLNAYDAWEAAGRQGGPGASYAFARRNFLSDGALRTAREVRVQYVALLADTGLIATRRSPGRASSVDGAAGPSRHADSWPVVRACLLAGLYPSVLRVEPAGGGGGKGKGRGRPLRLFAREHGWVKVHPASVLASRAVTPAHRWLVYAEMVRTATGYATPLDRVHVPSLAPSTPTVARRSPHIPT